MGKIEVKGVAARKIKYDLMRIKITFSAKEDTSDMASKNAMQDCEKFLGVVKLGGFNLSEISLLDDDIREERDYNNDKNYYYASRVIGIVSIFDMNLLDSIRSILNNLEIKHSFYFSYELSNEEQIKEELLKEALLSAKKQAEQMAEAIGQRVVGLVYADKNDRSSCDTEYESGQILCLTQVIDSIDVYECSDELSADTKDITEYVFTEWEVA